MWRAEFEGELSLQESVGGDANGPSIDPTRAHTLISLDICWHVHGCDLRSLALESQIPTVRLQGFQHAPFTRRGNREGAQSNR